MGELLEKQRNDFRHLVCRILECSGLEDPKRVIGFPGSDFESDVRRIVNSVRMIPT